MKAKIKKRKYLSELSDADLISFHLSQLRRHERGEKVEWLKTTTAAIKERKLKKVI
jgi:hypothetical protein